MKQQLEAMDTQHGNEAPQIIEYEVDETMMPKGICAQDCDLHGFAAYDKDGV